MCVVLRFAVFVARYLNYIEYRCCISDTLRSIQFYFIVEERCTKLVSFRLFGSNGGRTGPFTGEQVGEGTAVSQVLDDLSLYSARVRGKIRL